MAAGDEAVPVIPNYRVLRQLGSGGMGAVYLAQRAGRAAPCAVKVMRAGLLGQEQNVRRFWREVRVLMLQRHPGIVQFVDAGRTVDGRLFLATDLVVGRDLFVTIQRARALPFELWLNLADQLLAAVAAAHEMVGPDGARLGLVHRDLKPENVMIGWDGRVVVLDFGLAQARPHQVATRITRPGQVMGTPKYMAPEQIVEPEAVGPRTDQYAAALVLYHAAVGRTTGDDLPNGDDRAPVAELWSRLMEPQWKPLSTLAPQIPERLDRVLAQAMAHGPSDRFGTIERFRAELLRVAGIEPASASALGEHVRRLFPQEASDPVISSADVTAVAFEPTAYASGAIVEETAFAPAPRPEGPRSRPGSRLIAAAAALTAVAGAAALTAAVVVRSDSAAKTGPVSPGVVPIPTAKSAASEPPTRPEAAALGDEAERPDETSARTAPGRGSSRPPRRATRSSASGSGSQTSPAPEPTATLPDQDPPSAENSHPSPAFAKVEAALAAGDETAAARALRSLEPDVSRAIWNCIVQGLKTKPAADVWRTCR